MIFSESSFASDSTIKTPSLVPATTRSSSDFSISSAVGFKTNALSIYPTLAPATGPIKGKPEIVRAAEHPSKETISGSFSKSCETTVEMTCVSQR